MLTQFIKFSLIGVLNTIIHYTVFYYLYSIIGFHHLMASATGFGLAVVHSFLLNKHWTFRHHQASRYQFSKFIVISLFSLVINLSGMIFFVELLVFNPLLAQLIMIAFTLVINFVGNKYWSFKSKK